MTRLVQAVMEPAKKAGKHKKQHHRKHHNRITAATTRRTRKSRRAVAWGRDRPLRLFYAAARSASVAAASGATTARRCGRSRRVSAATSAPARDTRTAISKPSW